MRTYITKKKLPGIEIDTKLIFDESQTIFKMKGLITDDYSLYVIPMWAIDAAEKEGFIERVEK